MNSSAIAAAIMTASAAKSQHSYSAKKWLQRHWEEHWPRRLDGAQASMVTAPAAAALTVEMCFKPEPGKKKPRFRPVESAKPTTITMLNCSANARLKWLEARMQRVG